MSEASNAASPVSLTLALNLDTGQRVRRSRWLNARKAALLWSGCIHPGRVHSTGYTSAYGRRDEFPRSPPLRRGDGEEMPLAGHFLEFVSAPLLEREP
jgi:hypothetical protein